MEHRGLVRAKEIVPCNTILEVWKQKKHCTNKVIYKIDNRIESRRTRDLSRDFPVMVPFVFILLSVHWTFWIYGFSFHKIGNIYSHYLTFFFSFLLSFLFQEPGYTYADCMVLSHMALLFCLFLSSRYSLYSMLQFLLLCPQVQSFFLHCLLHW